MTHAQNKKVITRFPPSPTGVFHVGSARTALFNFLFARKYGGKFILRSEDTDIERSKREYEDNIIEGMKWLSMPYDEFYRQSERTAIYKKHIEAMIAGGYAYISSEQPTDEGKSASVIRFKNPGRKVVFHDEVRGDIEFDTTELGDFVIAKDMEHPLYHLAVVVDDFEMGVTHIIRGEDGISNTPRQILIQEAIGAPRPVYAHIPLILAPDKSKLSKRHGAVSVMEFRDEGYMPEALNNFLALLGWNPGNDREVFSMDELTDAFSLEHIQKGGAVFNKEKLNWLNKEYIKKLSHDRLLNEIVARLPAHILSASQYGPERLSRASRVIVEKIHTFGEVKSMAEAGDLSYFFDAPSPEKNSLCWKGETPDQSLRHLRRVIELLTPVSEWTETAIKDALWEYASKEGRGSVLWPTRFALSGKEKSPDPFALAEILGKQETLARLQTAMSVLDIA